MKYYNCIKLKTYINKIRVKTHADKSIVTMNGNNPEGKLYLNKNNYYILYNIFLIDDSYYLLSLSILGL